MRLALALASLALVLAACGGNEDAPSPSSEGATNSAPAASTGDVAESAEGGDVPATAAAARSVEAAAPEQAAETATAEAEASGATLWVTYDAGAELLLEADVAAGSTVIQVLDGAAAIETRYGGRFVTEVEGVSGSSNKQEDWFFLVNGIEPDLGAAEVKVADGDVVWWDHRSWIDGGAHPAAVVGAFPYPFHRGWKGKVRPVEVAAPPALAEAAAALEAFLRASPPDDPGAEPHRFVLETSPDRAGAELTASMGSKNSSPVTFLLTGTETAVRATVTALIEAPELITRRYSASFDDAGQVVEP